MAHNATAIANEFLERARSENSDITIMKLIKLVYIAHGWALALLDKPLIKDSIEAWQYGPVIKSVWTQFNVFGREPICQFADRNSEPAKYFYKEKWFYRDDSETAIREDLEPGEVSVINLIWDSYGRMSAARLSALTHQEGTPWAKAYNQFANMPIDNEDIKRHFQDLYQKVYGERACG